VLLADGATGTNFQQMRLQPGVAPEDWVFDFPNRVQELHARFARAGSEFALTCSFGANSPRLASGPLAGKARELNVRAAELAREVVGEERLVGGSIGPTAQLVEPYGPLTRGLCEAAYAEQAQALVDGGVDVLVLETFFALDEALWVVDGIRSVTELPLIVSSSFDQGTRTMMGLSPADVVAAFEPLGVAAIGANCGRSLEDNDAVVHEFLQATSVPVWTKPNAGFHTCSATPWSTRPTQRYSPPTWPTTRGRVPGSSEGAAAPPPSTSRRSRAPSAGRRHVRLRAGGLCVHS
jgi:5-methyltetrahydrofolate--homocysteine methyltransferase